MATSGSRSTVRLAAVVFVCMLGFSQAWWPFSSSGNSEEEEKGAHTAEQLEMVRFEMSTAEQKFLAEAQQFLDLSGLERCQYQVREWSFHNNNNTVSCGL